jgi:hypothetical protein
MYPSVMPLMLPYNQERDSIRDIAQDYTQAKKSESYKCADSQSNRSGQHFTV